MTLSGIGERISSHLPKGGWVRFNDNKSDYFQDAKVAFTFATAPWPIANINEMSLKPVNYIESFVHKQAEGYQLSRNFLGEGNSNHKPQ